MPHLAGKRVLMYCTGGVPMLAGFQPPRVLETEQDVHLAVTHGAYLNMFHCQGSERGCALDG